MGTAAENRWCTKIAQQRPLAVDGLSRPSSYPWPVRSNALMDQAAFLKGIAAAEAAQANELQRPAQWCAWCGNKSDGCSPIRVDDLLSSFHRATGVHRFIEPALKQLAAKKQKHGVKDSDQITYRQLAKLALPPGLSKFGLPVLQDATFLQTEAAICGDCSATACAADQPLGGTQIFNRVCGNLDHPAPLPAPLLLPDPVPEPEDYLEIAQRAQYEQSASAARFSKVPNHLRSMYFRGQPQPKHSDHYAGSFQMTRGIQVQPRLPGMQDTYGEIMSGTQLLTIKRRTQPKIGAEDAKFLKKRNAAYKQQSPMMKMVESFSPLRMQKDQNHITAGFTDGLLQQVNGVEYTVPVAKVAPLSFDSQ